MNKKFADELWDTAHKLHGTLDMAEICRLIIYAMFLQFVDLEKSMDEGAELPSYDEKFSVGYLALTYGKMIFKEQLVKYVQDIEADLMLNDRIISDELEKLLVKSDSVHVQKIFEAVGESGFQNRVQLYDAASFLLEKLSYRHGNLRDDTSFNRSLCRLESRLLDCLDGMTVYDGFCGYGFSANEAADGKGIVHLQDKNKSVAAAACIMALFKGNRIGGAGCGDSLTSPLSKNEKYDRIVFEPPFVSKYEDGYRSSIPEDNCLYPDFLDDASIALRHALAHLKDGGSAVLLVPMGVLVNHKSRGIRKHLIETYLDAVVELPAASIPNAGPAAALLVLKKDPKRKNIYMLDAKDFFENGGKNQLSISDENIKKIVEMYKRRENSEGISINLDKGKIEDGRNNLSASAYLVSDPKKTIMIVETYAYLKEYRQLSEQLSEVDSRLEALRSRFIINAG